MVEERRNISYAGRITLENSALIAVYSF